MANVNSNVHNLQDQLRQRKAELVEVSQQIYQLVAKKKELEKNVADIKSELQLISEASSTSPEYDRDDFPWSNTLLKKLRDVFHIENFRSHQKVAINATLSGVDLILVMPTGGGKSLCFQLPAMLEEGVTVVVSPLISLMEDQVQSLQVLGIGTDIFNAQTGKEDTKRIFQNMVDHKSAMKILYVTPEKLAKSKRFMSQLEKMYRAKRFARLVIDEVHCCSEWGHDFRPDYKFLGIMKPQYPDTPIIGLTATATANVLVDIQKMLNIEGCLVLRDSFYRPNLRYSVLDSTSKEKTDEIGLLIKEKFSKQSGIIYCLTDCEEVTKKLKAMDISCECYHAQMSPSLRTKVQQGWCNNEIKIIVATVAFGMGINKLDVRFVIHHSMSKSVETYYQETGRAGRDGKGAECILYYGFLDSFRSSSFMMTERNGIFNVYNMLRYRAYKNIKSLIKFLLTLRYTLEQVGCRKQFLSNHFGDVCLPIKNGCGNCDNCDFKEVPNFRREAKVNVTPLLFNVLQLLKHASRLDERMTALKLIDAWFKKGPLKLRVEEVQIPSCGREVCEKVIGHFLVDGYLKEDFHFTPYSTISYIVPGIKSMDLNPKQEIFYTFYSLKPNDTKKSAVSATCKSNYGSTDKKSEVTKRRIWNSETESDEEYAEKSKKSSASKRNCNIKFQKEKKHVHGSKPFKLTKYAEYTSDDEVEILD